MQLCLCSNLVGKSSTGRVVEIANSPGSDWWALISQSQASRRPWPPVQCCSICDKISAQDCKATKTCMNLPPLGNKTSTKEPTCVGKSERWPAPLIYLHPVIPTGRVVVQMHPQAMAFVRALFLHLVSKYFSRHNWTLSICTGIYMSGIAKLLNEERRELNRLPY